ncbi:MAG TPA: glycosyltransferase, partial [Bryobacterales bacterium]|nr:glycosyltransferase [Bryobacterales bacterium]
HLLLLNIWRKWAHAGTRPLPHLFVVGRRGWENENIVDMLERCEAIRPWVHELGPLPQADVVALMKNARALLMPTFAEGLGLPALEARSMNVPIIASDIPVFREVLAGDRRATLLDPIDGPSWERAILDMARA